MLEPELRRQEEERHRAAVAAAREAALAAFAAQGPRLARVLEAFSLAAPDEVALFSLRVEPGAASWNLVVDGQAEGADAGAAHAAFSRFLNALEASPLLGRPAAPPSLRARTADPADAVESVAEDVPPAAAPPPVQAVETPRPSASGPSYIEVARDGRLYRIPLRRQSGSLEAGRRAEEARRLREAALVRQAVAPAALVRRGSRRSRPPSRERGRVHAAIRGAQVKLRTGGLADTLERLAPFLTIAVVVTAGWFWFVQPRFESYLRARTDAAALEERVRTMQQASARALPPAARRPGAHAARVRGARRGG